MKLFQKAYVLEANHIRSDAWAKLIKRGKERIFCIMAALDAALFELDVYSTY